MTFWLRNIFLYTLLTAGIFLLITSLASHSYAQGVKPPPLEKEEAETEPPPEKDSPREGTLELKFTDGKAPLAARVELKTLGGKPALPEVVRGRFCAEGEASFQLPPGGYIIEVNAGPRYRRKTETVYLKEGALYARTFELIPLPSIERAKHTHFDPFYQPTGPMANETNLRTVRLQALTGMVDAIAIYPLKQILDNKTLYGTDPQGKHLSDPITESARKGLAILEATELRTPYGWAYSLNTYDEGFGPKRHGAMINTSFALAVWRGAGAFTVWQHVPPYAGNESEMHLQESELVFATVAGPLYDALDITHWQSGLKLWSFLLSEGYRVSALCGGPVALEAKDHALPEMGLTIPRADTGRQVLDSLQKGNGIISNGPALSVSLDGTSPGTVLPLTGQPRRIVVDAMISSIPGDRLLAVEFVYNGESLRQYRAGPGEDTMHIEETLPLPAPGWLFVRYISASGNAFAVSNPYFLVRSGSAEPSPLTSRVFVRLRDNGKPVKGTVDIWNLGTLAGRYEIGTKGRTFDLPPTAALELKQEGDADSVQHSIYTASGAEEYTWRLAEEPGSLAKKLRTKETYEQMRRLLRSVTILHDFSEKETSGE